MRNNTATGTTATASDHTGREHTGRVTSGYRGRFAPSPTGLLHLGSLIAALGSYLDARSQGGAWLVRIEDLDPPREQPGAAAQILATLARLGLQPDEPVVYQSTRRESYQHSFDQLVSRGLVYSCSCSRSEHAGGPYPGTCRGSPPGAAMSPQRFRLPDVQALVIADRLHGDLRFSRADVGDPVIRRRDGLFAYQLAVVVDDAAEGITDVVRGADLLDSTAWQASLQSALGLHSVRYAHLPVLTEADGSKLAKSRRSIAIDEVAPGQALFDALCLLQQSPPPELRRAQVPELLSWGIDHWQLAPLAGRRQIPLDNEDLGSRAGL